MALARVQGTGRVTASAVSSVSLTLPAPPTVGNGIVVTLINYGLGSGAATSVCIDNRGHTYTRAAYLDGTAIYAAIYVLPLVAVSAAPFTITVTFATAGSFEAAAMEVSGVGTSLSVDQVALRQSGSAPIWTGPSPALTASEVFVAAVHAIGANQATITVESVSPAWTQEFENLNYSATVAGEADTRVVTGAAGTTQSCTWTDATPTLFVAVLVAFKATGVTIGPLASPYGVENIRVGIPGPNPEIV